jgi:hypothetical protein
MEPEALELVAQEYCTKDQKGEQHRNTSPTVIKQVSALDEHEQPKQAICP